jgi:hypothetical protein
VTGMEKVKEMMAVKEEMLTIADVLEEWIDSDTM